MIERYYAWKKANPFWPFPTSKGGFVAMLATNFVLFGAYLWWTEYQDRRWERS